MLAAGCSSGGAARAVVSHASGPPGVVRVGLTDFRWPLDPARAAGRDETTLARALYSTPLRTDPGTGAVVSGLCTAWVASAEFRKWTFTCRDAQAIAATLRRVQRTRAAPDGWLFAGARVAAPSANRLVVRLPFSWRRFPYALTTVASAPRFVPGPFHLVSGSANRVIVRSATLTVVFQRYTARGAERAFERGEVDEAPVPLGDIAWSRARLGAVVHSRTLLGLDGVVFQKLPAALRRVYWQTADRSDYAALVPESSGAAAFSVVATSQKATPRAYRNAVKAIATLPRVQVRIGVPADPVLRYGARLLYGQWRDVGLGPRLVSQPTTAGSFMRVVAAYPEAEALPAQLVVQDRVGSRALLARALAATEQGAALARFDDDLRVSAQFVPVSWVVDARLVSPRLRGWRENALGDVDYGAVTALASGRSPQP